MKRVSKNLLIFINPSKAFVNRSWGDENEMLVKVQIDNSLSLGWDRKDILLVTNFDYEYNGVKSFVVSDDVYCDFSPTVSKINVIIKLIEQGTIGDELYWFHDLDAFQLEDLKEVDLDGTHFGLTEYGRTTMNRRRDKRFSTGTLFFNKHAKEIFDLIKIKTEQYKCNEEVALLELSKIPKYNINQKIKRLNITYNFATRKRNIPLTYESADKPLKVIHFHPFDVRPVNLGNDNMGVCVYGKNTMNKVLVSERLIELFKKHGIIK